MKKNKKEKLPGYLRGKKLVHWVIFDTKHNSLIIETIAKNAKVNRINATIDFMNEYQELWAPKTAIDKRYCLVGRL